MAPFSKEELSQTKNASMNKIRVSKNDIIDNNDYDSNS